MYIPVTTLCSRRNIMRICGNDGRSAFGPNLPPHAGMGPSTTWRHRGLPPDVECVRLKLNLELTTYRKEHMKPSLLAVGLAAALMLAWSVGRVQGQQGSEGKVLFVSAAQAKFSPMNPGVSMAAIWGDSNMGAHATFSKFAPNYDAGMHTHTNDVWIVVMKGAYLYKDDAGEKRVGPGDFIRVPGGHKHWSGGDKKEGALFYEESNGKFDFNPVK
jgi:mannose-6-phosphate isomerase-like protein (cupin superfamily)